MKILIVGIPGTGKTTIGNYLSSERGFIHIDMESGDNIPEAWGNPDSFVAKLEAMPGDVVVTWGFVPNGRFIGMVNQLKDKEFKLIWFDGNREFSRNMFVERNKQNGDEFLKKSLDDLRVQMKRINESDVINKINPKIIDTFNANGSFRSLEDVVKDILD